MKISAGLLPYRRASGLEVLIAHPGGPFFARRDVGFWSVVKGEVRVGEDLLEAARREFAEETGWPAPGGPFHPLGTITQRGGKQVTAWGLEGDYDPQRLEPGTFDMRWRGRVRSFPEIDRVTWAAPALAAELLNPAQAPLVERLTELLSG